ncbi:cell division regulator GpsB [Enterococcus rivorum]|uniref:Cell cycle protein GpsB n=1 Tax=Enterococcus rivorum TaxID=762845 RepID=A0A1E5KSZ5_9ENTE|nr:cell division regulator GpsB [Enterococcus rivorum]MBP2098034.1 DivIVA domain-containing protein [Enterococcus rivorum]OEH80983.1 cell division protein GpsB [Enterococcus rivorum]
MANLVYSPKDILQKEFKTKMRGYDPEEVDEFLDNVIKDYEAYNKELLILQEENNRLLAKMDQMAKVQQAMPRGGAQEVPKSTAVTNFDILKRLSNLEREVFGKKLDDTPSVSTSHVASRYSSEIDNSETRQF